MGAVASSKTREEIDAAFIANPNTTTCWGLHHVQSLHAAFQRQGLDVGVSKAEFTQLLSDGVPGATSVIEELWSAFDPRATGLAHALEAFAGLSALSEGDLSAKLQFLFSLFDFGGEDAVSYDELVILLVSALSGVVRLTGKGRLPEHSDVERMADAALVRAGKDASSALAGAEFCAWALETLHVDGPELSVDDLVGRLELVAEDDGAEEEVKSSDDDADGISNPSGNDTESDLADELVPFAVPSAAQQQARSADDDDDVDSFFALEADAAGDQFMAVKPYLGAVREPSQPPDIDPSEPEADLLLEWVHGYRSADVRNNVRALATGELVYHTAAVGVVLTTAGGQRKQRFFFGHTDDIVSLAVHPDGVHVATGEVGKRPAIHIWNVQTMQSVRVLKGFHRRAVLQLAFSHSGRYLASVGQDDGHALAVYDWQNKGARRPSHSAKTGGNKVLHVAWTEGDARVATVGVKHVAFWEVTGARARKEKGLFGKKGSIQPILCAAGFAGGIVTGTASGRLYRWAGRECQGGAQQHQGAVNCLWTAGGFLYSGGKDGKVKKYDDKLLVVDTFDVAVGTDSRCPRVRSVATTADGALVIGTKGAEIYVGGVKQVEGHFRGELWGLAAHPSEARYATCGDDKVLRLWDANERACTAATELPSFARAAAWSPDGSRIAVALGGRAGGVIPAVNGAVLVLDATSPALEVLHQAHDARRWIEEIKYSPDGTTLAVGAHDGVVYMYEADLALRCECRGHSSYITHLDFTADGASMQTTCGAYELLFWDVNSGEQKKGGASELKDAEWASWTCTLGWPVQGIWPARADGTDVNAVDRSRDGKTLVTADDFGLVKLYRWPCAEEGALCTEYEGHSSHVTNVRFLPGDSFVVSVGGNDRSVFQWRYVDGDVADEDAVDAPEDVTAELSDDGEEAAVGQQAQDKAQTTTPDDQQPPRGGGSQAGQWAKCPFEFEMAPAEIGDQFMAVRPYLGAIVPPTEPPAVAADAEAPADGLELAWVHGYQAQAMRNSLRYTAGGNIVYSVASVGVVYNANAHAQSFFVGPHADDIISLAVSRDGRFVATGELGRRPRIHVWEADSQRRVATLKGHRRGVCQLAFSHSGQRLASVGLDDDHSIIVYDWANEARLVKQKCHKDRVSGITWTADDAQIVTVGAKHVAFWALNGRTLRKKKGLFGATGQRQHVFCVAPLGNAPDKVVTGQADGSLYVWDGRKCVQAVDAHTGPVYALFATPDGAAVFTGGRDGKVCRFDAGSLARTEAARVQDEGDSVRSVCVNAHGTILIGTGRSRVTEVEVAEEDGQLTVLPRLDGHFYGETWGLAAHPSQPEFATVGDDKALSVWSLDTRRLLRRTALDTGGRAVAYSPDGSRLAVGLGGHRNAGDETGSFRVLDAETLEVMHSAQDSRQWIQDIKFSPDGSTLAVAAHDNKVYLYSTSDWAPKGVCSGHSSYITHMDFSVDSTRLQTNCGAYELLFWDAATGQQLPGGATELRDEAWASWTCTLGWPVQGIWPPGSDGTDINSVDRSHDGQLLATADDFGVVRVFTYPCAESADCVEHEGHSSHVTNVRWSFDDRFVLSTGGNDRGVFQWARQGIVVADARDSDLEAEGNVPVAFAMDEIELEEAGAGDEFGAVKPWLGAIVPPSDPPAAGDGQSPQWDELELEWVHGYRTFDTRNNLFALASGEVAYHTAAVGVVYNPASHKQRHYRGHSDDIISMAMHPDGNTVATGQIGKRPEIHVWNATTMERLAVLRGFHKRGVVNLAFSADGSLLLSTGQDNHNKVALYDWGEARVASGRRKGLVGSVKGHSDKILDVAMGPNNEICVVGVKLVKFWLDGLVSKPKKGVFGDKGTLQPVMSAQWVGEQCVTGTASGHLYVWEGRQLARAVRAHNKAVNALAPTAAGGVISGGKEGVVKVWAADLATVVAEYNLSSADVAGARLGLPGMPTDPNDPRYFPGVRGANGVRAVCETDSGGVLIGTRGAEIIEVGGAAAKPALHHEAHCFGETWGLAVHPSKGEFATAGDDKTLRVWSANGRRLARKTTLDSFVRAVAWSPDGALIAVGLGGRLGGRSTGNETGAFRVLNADTLEVVHAAQDSSEWIQDVKFSPDGNTLAVGSHDNKVYLYDVTTWSAKAVCSGHSSYITHMDFTADSAFLQTNCGAYELLFWDVSTGQQVRGGASELKDEEWASWTCTLGWPVQGIWPPRADGTDINSVDRSNDGQLLVTADDFGVVKLFTYPCLEPGAEFNESQGHSSHVTNVRWSFNDRHVFSTGGNDQAVFQWRHRSAEQPPVDAAALSLVAQEDAPDSDDAEFDEAVTYAERSASQELANAGSSMRWAGDFQVEEAGGGDEFGAVKPWLGAIVEPSDPPLLAEGAPEAGLALDWVHGYQGQAVRNSVRYTAAGDVVYTAAAVGVVYNPRSHTQRFFRGHTDDIISLAVSRDGRYAATGQLGRRPTICVWDTASLKQVATLKGHLRRGVPQLAFSPCGRLVAGVGLDDNHMLAVYDWGAEALVARGKTGGQKILGLTFSHDSRSVAVVGVKTVATYTLRGRKFNKTKGLFGKVGTIQTVMCCEYLPNGVLATGQRDGSVYLWEGRDCVRAIAGAHAGAVGAMSLAGNTRLVTGGDDGVVKVWDADMNAAEVACPTQGAKVRSACLSASGLPLVGTVRSQIFEGEELLVDAHFRGELWGLAMGPNGTRFATCGDDKTLRVWDVSQRALVGSAVLPAVARAAAFSPDGARIAVGLGKGSEEGAGGFVVLDASSVGLPQLHSDRPAEQWIQDVKFSPDGTTLAVGAHDNKVYLYSTGDWASKGVCSGHSSYITHMDFSVDSTRLQTNCGAYELLYWDTDNGEQLPGGASELNDEQWASWTCTLGWPVQGIWPPAADGTDINAVDRNPDGDLLVTADDMGLVRLLHYPCVEPGAQAKVARGHSSHVTNARWTVGNAAGKYVVTTGGNDRAVMQWVRV